MRAGVNGVSLYELLIYPRNRRWAGQWDLDARTHLPNYLVFQIAAQILARNGYRKNTFNHWADPRDGATSPFRQGTTSQSRKIAARPQGWPGVVAVKVQTKRR